MAYVEPYVDAEKVYGFETEYSQTIYKPGSTVTCAETLNSPTSVKLRGSSGSTSTRTVKVVGTHNENVAINAIRKWLLYNGFYDYGDAGRPVKEISITADQSGVEAWDGTIEFSDANQEKWCDEVSMSTMGGSAHITTSLATIASVSCISYEGQLQLPENTYRKIGLDSDNRPEGCDVKRPNFQLNLTLNWSWENFSSAYVTYLLSKTPTMNATSIWGFAPGELLFEGVNVDRVSFTNTFDGTISYRWRVQYTFSGMPNVAKNEIVLDIETGQPVMASSIYMKRGWDYVWSKYVKTNIGGEAHQILQQVNVEQVYEFCEFRTLGVPNNIFTLDEDIDNFGNTGWQNA